MGMSFHFKTKKDALAFAAAVEQRFKLMTDTSSFSHFKDAMNPDGRIWQTNDLAVGLINCTTRSTGCDW
jgi:hypothetical protein